MAESSPLPVIEESRDLVFHCYAISKPRSAISWYHNNIPLNVGISEVGNNSSLTITQVDRTHYGNYKCIELQITYHQLLKPRLLW